MIPNQSEGVNSQVEAGWDVSEKITLFINHVMNKEIQVLLKENVKLIFVIYVVIQQVDP